MSVLKKRRYRDLKKVGIGGFQAKSRNSSKKTKDDAESSAETSDKPKKRQSWRPKKNKILTQYPEYIQDSFFGRSFMDSYGSVPAEDLFDEKDDTVKKRQETGKPTSMPGLELGKEALSALAEIRKNRELERKRKLEEQAAKQAEEESKKMVEEGSGDPNISLVKTNETSPVKDEPSSSTSASGSVSKAEEDVEKMEVDDDILEADLPSDIFGEDILKMMEDDDTNLGEIDDTALEEAEKEDRKIAEDLGDVIPDIIDASEMEDVLFNMMDGRDRARDQKDNVDEDVAKEEVKSETGPNMEGVTQDVKPQAQQEAMKPQEQSQTNEHVQQPFQVQRPQLPHPQPIDTTQQSPHSAPSQRPNPPQQVQGHLPMPTGQDQSPMHQQQPLHQHPALPPQQMHLFNDQQQRMMQQQHQQIFQQQQREEMHRQQHISLQQRPQHMHHQMQRPPHMVMQQIRPQVRGQYQQI